MKSHNKQLYQALKFTLFSISAGIIQIGSFAILEMIFYAFSSEIILEIIKWKY